MELTDAEAEELRRLVIHGGEQEAAKALDVDRLTFARAMARLPLKPRTYRRIAARLISLSENSPR
jgi:hypothetical protein